MGSSRRGERGLAVTPPVTPSSIGFGSRLQEAHGAYARGAFSRCLDLVEAVLGQDPDHHVALRLGDHVHLKLGNIEISERMLAEAGVQMRNEADAYFSLGGLLQERNRSDVAEKVLEAAIRTDPAHEAACHAATLILIDQGRAAEAEVLLRTCLEARPEAARLQALFARTLILGHRHDEAMQSVDRAISLEPDAAEFHALRGEIAAHLDRHAEAVASAEQALSVDPDHPQAHRRHGLSSLCLGRFAAAISGLTHALRHDPNDSETRAALFRAHLGAGEAWQALRLLPEERRTRPGPDETGGVGSLTMGRAHLNGGWLKDAETAYKAAMSDPEAEPEAVQGLARIHIARADPRAAEEALGRLLLRMPHDVGALCLLARCRRFESHDEIAVRLESLLARPATPAADKMRLSFALARVYDDLEDPDRAFAYLAAGNRFWRSFEHESSNPPARDMDAAMEHLDAEFTARGSRNGYPSSAPVFITGFPRSGASFLARCCSAAGDVANAGSPGLVISLVRAATGSDEGALASFMPRLKSLDGRALAKLGHRIVNELRGISGNSLQVLDLSPSNLPCLGLIHAALPNAHVLHIRRDPMDTCFANFRCLPHGPYRPGGSLEDIAEAYRRHVEIMAHWRRLFPQAILDVDFEDLVDKPEQVARRALNFCGIPANTTSRGSLVPEAGVVGRWRRYERQLRPLSDRLAAWDLLKWRDRQ